MILPTMSAAAEHVQLRRDRLPLKAEAHKFLQPREPARCGVPIRSRMFTAPPVQSDQAFAEPLTRDLELDAVGKVPRGRPLRSLATLELEVYRSAIC